MQAMSSSRQGRPGSTERVRQPPLIVHVIHHLGVGGLENGLVNLINHIPPERYRHAIVCLKGYSDFRRRITRENVEIVALNKREGHDFRDRKSTRLNSSHLVISYAVFCLKKK